VLLWREENAKGDRLRCTAIIGAIEEYPNERLAWEAASGLRLHINLDHNRKRNVIQPISIGDLIDHYVLTELSAEASLH
jgi:hypothetical protein